MDSPRASPGCPPSPLFLGDTARPARRSGRRQKHCHAAARVCTEQQTSSQAVAIMAKVRASQTINLLTACGTCRPGKAKGDYDSFSQTQVGAGLCPIVHAAWEASVNRRMRARKKERESCRGPARSLAARPPFPASGIQPTPGSDRACPTIAAPRLSTRNSPRPTRIEAWAHRQLNFRS